MLNALVVNSIETFNTVYLWTVLNKRKNNIYKLISIVFILSIMNTIMQQLGLSFIFMYIIEISVIKIIYRKSLKDVILEFFLVILLEISLELIIYSIVNKFVYNYTYTGFIVELIILAEIIVFSKVNALNKNITFERINSNISIYFISICSIYVMVFKVIWSYDNTIVVNNLLIAVVTFITLVISQIFIYLYVTKIIKEKEALKVSNEYNEVINEIVQEIRQRQHDFVNYKTTIRGIVSVVDEKDVKATISNYMKDEEMHDNKINELLYINNVVIRSITYRNICKAEKHDVSFQYKIENNVLDNILSYHEISNLLNNLLNNSFDEVLKDKCHKKNVEVKIFNKGKTSHLIVKNQIVNPNDINLNEMFTRGYSTKNAAGTRGYGLYNVQQIVNLRKGCVKLNVECGEIIFDIYFNNSSG
jgi:two-component system sensor histidine kinase AgrC